MQGLGEGLQKWKSTTTGSGSCGASVSCSLWSPRTTKTPSGPEKRWQRLATQINSPLRQAPVKITIGPAQLPKQCQPWILQRLALWHNCPPTPSGSEDSGSDDTSSEDAPLTNAVNEVEFKWLNFVDLLTEHKLTWDESLTVQSVWEEAYRERYALAGLGEFLQQNRTSRPRASAIAALHFGHAYYFNELICFREWQSFTLPGSTVLKMFGRAAERKWTKEGLLLPPTPQCLGDTYKEALRSTSTLREMLREHNASANAILLEERQEDPVP